MNKSNPTFLEVAQKYKVDMDAFYSYVNGTMASLMRNPNGKSDNYKSNALSLIYSHIVMINLLNAKKEDASDIHRSLQLKKDYLIFRKLITYDDLIAMPIVRDINSEVNSTDIRILNKIAARRDTKFNIKRIRRENQLTRSVFEKTKYDMDRVGMNDGLEDEAVIISENSETHENAERLFAKLKTPFYY